MSYIDIINNHKAEMLRRKDEGEALELDVIFGPVVWSEEEANKPFLAWLLKQKLVTRLELSIQRKRSRATALLGRSPASPCDYVAAYAALHQAVVSYDGQISVINDRGLRVHKIITAYETEARVFAAEYGLPFPREAINDAVCVWHADSSLARLDVIRTQLAGTAEFDWCELARRCFDCSDVPVTLVAAILQKFVHQVLRKLHDLPVASHLMPVILGKQGSGKSWFIRWLTQPLAEFRRDTDFRAIGDDRNIGLWSAYVIVVDEMAYADKSDIETVKHVITADVLDRRPMRKNVSVRVPQRATLIGASNKTIGELIRDETGSRRFVGLQFREDADWEYLNSLPALDAWISVAADGPDPLGDHRTAFAELQAREQYMSPVEDWLRSLQSRREDILPSTNPIPPQTLYEAFVSHFQARNAGMRPKSMSAWEQEVGRLLKGGRKYAVQKVRTSAGVEWRWSTTGERSL